MVESCELLRGNDYNLCRHCCGVCECSRRAVKPSTVTFRHMTAVDNLQAKWSR